MARARPSATEAAPGATAALDASKGDVTRRRILERAMYLAGTRGLDGITIGELASDLGLSKSGLFAHFKSKERLQLDVLESAGQHFGEHVLVPALAKPRGQERLRAIFENWLEWIRSRGPSSGCVFLAGAMEWDDRDGPVRDALVHWFEQLQQTLQRAVRLCVEVGHFRPEVDVAALAYDLQGVALKYHLDLRLLRAPEAHERALGAFDRLLIRARG
jgi:AcrR family transcriptional regulator